MKAWMFIICLLIIGASGCWAGYQLGYEQGVNDTFSVEVGPKFIDTSAPSVTEWWDE